MEDYILLKRLHAYFFTLLFNATIYLSLRVVYRVAVILAFKR